MEEAWSYTTLAFPSKLALKRKINMKGGTVGIQIH